MATCIRKLFTPKILYIEYIDNTINREHPQFFLLENVLHEIFQNENFIYGIYITPARVYVN